MDTDDHSTDLQLKETSVRVLDTFESFAFSSDGVALTMVEEFVRWNRRLRVEIRQMPPSDLESLHDLLFHTMNTTLSNIQQVKKRKERSQQR
ncbi:MAG: hypothetical protein NVS4B8_30920 [Herpetosiphon sp.]